MDQPVPTTQPRYTVASVTGCSIGAGAFVVMDGQLGTESREMLWREDAESLARRLNAEHVARESGSVE